MSDNVQCPEHYTKFGIEVISITQHLPFCLGNVVKYVLRAPYKGGVEDCDKALKYLEWSSSYAVVGTYEAIKYALYNVLQLMGELKDGDAVDQAQYSFLEMLRTVIMYGNPVRLRPFICALRTLLEK